jgi:hypothetical protein
MTGCRNEGNERNEQQKRRGKRRDEKRPLFPPERAPSGGDDWRQNEKNEKAPVMPAKIKVHEDAIDGMKRDQKHPITE